MNTDAFAPEVQRDRWGRPLIIPPEGGKAVAYLRPSSLPDQLNDDFAISRWKMQQLALGMGKRKDLWQHAASLTADDKGKLQEIVDSALEMVAENTQANLGSAIHAYLQNGLDRPDDMPEVHACATGIRAAMEAAGLVIIDGTHEQFVINDEIQAAGSWDGLVRDVATDEVLIWDIKTCDDVDKLKDYKVQSWSVQESVYANASRFLDGSPVPDGISKDRGVVCYVSRNTGACRIIFCDLLAGYRGAKLARAAYDFKKLKAKQISTDGGRWGPVVQMSPTADITPVSPTADITPVSPNADKRTPLAARIKAIAAAGHTDTMRALWPAGVPTLKASDAHTAAELELIEAAVWQCEKQHKMSFPDDVQEPARPANQMVDSLLSVAQEPDLLAIDEGEDITADEVASVGAVLKVLTPERRGWCQAIAAEANRRGYSLSVSKHPTRRRHAIACALIALSSFGDDDMVRALLAHVMRTDQALHPTVHIAEVISALTITEAQRIHELANSPTLAVTPIADGRYTVAA